MDRHAKQLYLLATAAEELVAFGQARLVAAVIKHNRILAFGANSGKTDPLAKRFGKNEHAETMHAELAAIKNAINRYGTKEVDGATLYVARCKFVRQADKSLKAEWGLAAPCRGCQAAIVAFGIKKVYYTTEVTGEYESV